MKPPRKNPEHKSWHPPLDRHDVELWEDLKKTVKPLPNAANIEVEVKKKAERKEKKPAVTEKQETGLSRGVGDVFLPVPSPSLDRITKRKIKGGRVAIEDSLDLHGMRQEAAHRALNKFIERSRERGLKLVLVVTGKGDRAGGIGVLRQSVPQWLAQGEIAGSVLSYSTAAQPHGGEGALYIRLRRKKRNL